MDTNEEFSTQCEMFHDIGGLGVLRVHHEEVLNPVLRVREGFCYVKIYIGQKQNVEE